MSQPSPTVTKYRRLRIFLGVLAVGGGLVLILVATTIGHCSAFGGRCPAESPPLLDDDVFGMALMGGLLGVAVPLWLARPSWRRLGRALAIALPVALIVGFIGRSTAAG